MESKIESAVDWAIGIANDNSHGYSQTVRWGPSYDCSSLVISAYQQAGVPVKTRGATYTGNMRTVFMSCGFKNVTGVVNLATGAGLKRGDVLLNDANHTAMMINSTQLVHARSSEGTTDTADNSGNEIRVQNYWNYPWNCVLRYPDDEEAEPDPREDDDGIIIPEPDIPDDSPAVPASDSGDVILLRYGDGMNNPRNDVKAMQLLLRCHGYTLDADGEFGHITELSLKRFQAAQGLKHVDGICGEETWKYLTKK